MKVKLLMRQKGNGEAGDIVEVSQDRADFLFSVGAAEPAEAREHDPKPEAEETQKEKKPAAKTTQKKPAKTTAKRK